jgi:hypothetical protein
MKTYRVVPYVPILKATVSGVKGVPIEGQLEAILNQYAAQGWVFESYQSIPVELKPGCIAGLLGVKSSIDYYTVLIFSK